MQNSKTRLLHDPQYIYAPQARAQTQESYISESGGAQAVSGSENEIDHLDYLAYYHFKYDTKKSGREFYMCVTTTLTKKP